MGTRFDNDPDLRSPECDGLLDGPIKVWMTHLYDNKPWQTSGSQRGRKGPLFLK
jgi:hypothetical protein